jgi:hypothetical protein
MSFARFALRTAAVHALLGRTLVGTNVRDSDISAIDIAGDGSLRTDQDRPFVLVYTDDSTAEEADLRNLRQNGTLDFVAEFGIATAMTDTNERGESTVVGFNLPATDAAFELVLDMLDRQIVTALTGSSPWGDLWRRMSNAVSRIERRRAASTDNGTRIAARQLRIRLEVRPDPVWGQPLAPTSIWREFLTALQGADAPLAAVASGFLGPQGAEVTTEIVRAAHGHTVREARDMGYAPFHPGGEAYVIREAVVEADA